MGRTKQMLSELGEEDSNMAGVGYGGLKAGGSHQRPASPARNIGQLLRHHTDGQEDQSRRLPQSTRGRFGSLSHSHHELSDGEAGREAPAHGERTRTTRNQSNHVPANLQMEELLHRIDMQSKARDSDKKPEQSIKSRQKQRGEPGEGSLLDRTLEELARPQRPSTSQSQTDLLVVGSSSRKPGQLVAQTVLGVGHNNNHIAATGKQRQDPLGVVITPGGKNFNKRTGSVDGGSSRHTSQATGPRLCLCIGPCSCNRVTDNMEMAKGSGDTDGRTKLGFVKLKGKSSRTPQIADGPNLPSPSSRKPQEGSSGPESEASLQRIFSHNGNRNGRTLYMMGPLTLKKFCNTVRKVMRQWVYRQMAEHFRLKDERAQSGFMILVRTLSERRMQDQAAGLESIQDHPKVVAHASRLIGNFCGWFERSQTESRSQGFALLRTNLHLQTLPGFATCLREMRTAGSNSASDSQKPHELLSEALALRTSRLQTLDRVLFRAGQRHQHQTRRFLSQAIDLLRDTSAQDKLRSLLPRLDALLSLARWADILRGYYGIKAAGGRLLPLHIILERKLKIDSSRLRLCLKKLRIWSRYRVSQQNDPDSQLRIIIVKSESSEQHGNQLDHIKRMLLKKSFEGVTKVLALALKGNKSLAFERMQERASRVIAVTRLAQFLQPVLASRPLRLGWVEMSLTYVQRKSFATVKATPKDTNHFSPRFTRDLLNSKFPLSDDKKAPATNPLFRYYEEKTAGPQFPIYLSHEDSPASHHRKSSSRGFSGSGYQSGSSPNLLAGPEGYTHSSELEILRTGLDLDLHLQATRIRTRGTSNSGRGLAALESALKAETGYGAHRDQLKTHALREVALKLLSAYRRHLRIAFDSIERVDTHSEMQRVREAYLRLFLSSVESVTRQKTCRLIESAWRQLVRATPKNKITHGGVKNPVLLYRQSSNSARNEPKALTTSSVLNEQDREDKRPDNQLSQRSPVRIDPRQSAFQSFQKQSNPFLKIIDNTGIEHTRSPSEAQDSPSKFSNHNSNSPGSNKHHQSASTLGAKRQVTTSPTNQNQQISFKQSGVGPGKAEGRSSNGGPVQVKSSQSSSRPPGRYPNYQDIKVKK